MYSRSLATVERTREPEHSAPVRLLVVADAEVPDAVLVEAVRAEGGETAEVHVVAPALASRLGFWTNADDGRRRAHARLEPPSQPSPEKAFASTAK
jgi:hypothetical protein